jgi:tetratricopeptide (TPR) repeat protein
MVGFVLAYLAFENIGSRQPQRRLPPQTGAVQNAPPGNAGSAPEANPGNSGGGPNFTREQVQQLSAYVEQHPDDPDAVIQLANMNFDIRNWQRAAELYEHHLELQPEDPDVLSDLGICYREMGEPQRALKEFDRAQEIAPQHWESRFNEVVVLGLDLGNFEAAEKVLDELRAIRPGDQNVERLAAEVERRRNAA